MLQRLIIEILNLCCTGLYYFKRVDTYLKFYSDYISEVDIVSELYIAPIYNILIKNGLGIRYQLIKRDQIFFGIPSEYEEFISLLDSSKKN
jgi:hypothetical protein